MTENCFPVRDRNGCGPLPRTCGRERDEWALRGGTGLSAGDFPSLVGYTPRHEHGQVKEFLCQTRDPLLKRPEVCP